MYQKNNRREKPEFEQRLVDIARVTRTTAGGKRLRFRACVVIGDLKGKIAWGTSKGADVSIAINKAVSQAKKRMVKINTYKDTIAHEVKVKSNSAIIFIKPAPEGRGIIAGGVVRDIFELAGVKDVIAKMYGTNNKINNVKATFKALEKLRKVSEEEITGVKTDKISNDKDASKIEDTKKIEDKKEIKKDTK
ncbi:30S ribosomal protein S5 [bacterium]|nr:30S ribosomal protein S5 [bacterium]